MTNISSLNITRKVPHLCESAAQLPPRVRKEPNCRLRRGAVAHISE